MQPHKPPRAGGAGVSADAIAVLLEAAAARTFPGPARASARPPSSASAARLSPRTTSMSRLQLGPPLGPQSAPPLLTPRTLAHSQPIASPSASPRMTPRQMMSPSGSAISLGSRSLSQSRFILPDEERRLQIKGGQERLRAESREHREQLREAKSMQEEQEHKAKLARMAVDREARKQALEADRMERKRDKLELRDVSAWRQWDRFPKVTDLAMSGVATPVGNLSRGGSVGNVSPRSRRGQPPTATVVGSIEQFREPPQQAFSSSATPLASPRMSPRGLSRSGSWATEMAAQHACNREELHDFEHQRLLALGEFELKVAEEREAKAQERQRLIQNREAICQQRVAELELVRLGKEQRRQQELQKRQREREQREQQSLRRSKDGKFRLQQEQVKSVQAHVSREHKVYVDQRTEEE
ncbi:unnamed protein product, partial [Polarella glacialis]